MGSNGSIALQIVSTRYFALAGGILKYGIAGVRATEHMSWVDAQGWDKDVTAGIGYFILILRLLGVLLNVMLTYFCIFVDTS